MHESSPVTHEDEASAAIALLPPARLAVLLCARRAEARVGMKAAARAAGIKIGALKDIEAGRTPVKVGVLAALLTLYRVPLGEFVPPRRPRVLTKPDGTPEEILRGYVDLVRQWRNAGRKEKLNFRSGDVVTLAKLLGTDPDEIERRLIAMTGCSRAEARLLRKWLVAALVTMPLAYGVVGGAIPAAAAALTGSGAPAGSAPTSQLAVAVTDSSGVMLPGSGASHLTYTITNPGNSAQGLARTSAHVRSVDGNVTEHGAPVPGCKAAWFAASDNPPAEGTVKAHASVQGSVDVTMQNVNANQDACQGASPDITVDAG